VNANIKKKNKKGTGDVDCARRAVAQPERDSKNK